MGLSSIWILMLLSVYRTVKLLSADLTKWSVDLWKGRWTGPVGETYLPERTSLALIPAGDRSICFMYLSLMFTWLLLPKLSLDLGPARAAGSKGRPQTVREQWWGGVAPWRGCENPVPIQKGLRFGWTDGLPRTAPSWWRVRPSYKW